MASLGAEDKTLQSLPPTTSQEKRRQHTRRMERNESTVPQKKQICQLLMSKSWITAISSSKINFLHHCQNQHKRGQYRILFSLSDCGTISSIIVSPTPEHLSDFKRARAWSTIPAVSLGPRVSLRSHYTWLRDGASTLPSKCSKTL